MVEFTYIAHNNQPSMHVNIPAPGILWAKRVRIFSQLKPQLMERLSRKLPKILCHKNTCLAILCLWPFFGDRWKSRDPLTHSVAVNVTNPMFSGGWKKSSEWKSTGCLGYMSGMKNYPVMWGSFHKPWNKWIPSLTNQDDSMESILVAFYLFRGALCWITWCFFPMFAPVPASATRYH